MSAARVSRRGANRWASGHPWIYRSDLLEVPDSPAGAVQVVDPEGRPLGTALWSPPSTISLRRLGEPELIPDAAFWGERIDAAAEYRRSLGLALPGPASRSPGSAPAAPRTLPLEAAGTSPHTNACRLVHGEADALPSLVVDLYGEVLVTQFLSAGLESFRRQIVEALVDRFRPAGLLARNDVPVRRHEGLPRSVELLYGDVPEEVEVREDDVRYVAAPWQGQKTGAFLDQRENRVHAGLLSRGKVLDCFAYHGSFSVHLARGADSVLAVDSSADALDRARVNAACNGFNNVDVLEGNAFDVLRAHESEGVRYDLIVLDPPAFAKRRDALAAALRGYKELNLRAMRLLAPGGHLCTFSCSYHVSRERFTQMLAAAAGDAGRPIRWIEARGQSADHPEILQIPETSYLKGAVLQAL